MSTSPTTSDLMAASVYRGSGHVAYEQVGIPAIGAGEILIKVAACGICHTDLKKIEYDLLDPPRIYGHETAGTVAAVGAGVTKFSVGDRACVFHHIPCMDCFYCRHKDYAQCKRYIEVGVTAGFEPAGGGFAQYVRVMDWIVESGVEKIPEGDGTMLDNTMIVYISDNSDKHHASATEWPMFVLGNLGGKLKTSGRYLAYPRYGTASHKQTIGNWLTTICHAAGVPQDHFGQPDFALGKLDEQNGPLSELLT